MNNLRNFKSEESKLFAVVLGGRAQGFNIEVHDVVFAVAKTYDELAQALKMQWAGSLESLHIDAYQILDYIEGFEVKLIENRNQTSDCRVYFVNIGSYTPMQMGENHFFKLVVAQDKTAAVKKALKENPVGIEMLHADNIVEIDDCIQIDKVGGLFIHLFYTGETKQSRPANGWHKID